MIKFRAWCPTFNRHFDVVAIEWDTDSIWVLDCGCRDDWSFSEVTLEQYTGLKDKNGKEIYVGDILLNERDNVHGFVESIDGMFMWSGDTWCEAVSYVRHSLHIVGNIHESKELLK